MTPDWRNMFVVFGRIGLLSFGGPAAQIALMHQQLVTRHRWMSEPVFLRALSFCMLLPGPEAMQLATYAGWKQRGILGGLLAGGLFVLPGAITITALVLAYAHYGDLPVVQALFVGIQASVVAIVALALVKVARKALDGPISLGVALAAFVALFVLALPFPVVILIAALIGALAMPVKEIAPPIPLPPLQQSLRVILIGGVLWALPIVLCLWLEARFLSDLALFFSRLAVVTFGGAYAVLAYMTQTVVNEFGWITTPQMMDALGLAETTPGPLILVTQFVGMLAGMTYGGLVTAIAAGVLVIWVTFVPCFIWIFAGAPLLDWLAGQSRLQGALAGITAAVVGVIANLSLWFAMHVFFGDVGAFSLGPFSVAWPHLPSIMWTPIALFLAALWLMRWRGINLLWTLCLSAGGAIVVHLI